MKDRLDIFIDGACSGNPGRAGIGILIKKDSQVIKEISKPIGEATNNIAEYSALIYALEEALVMQAKCVKIFTDSELVYHQVRGKYKVKNQNLKFLFDQVRLLCQGFQSVSFEHVLRDKNKDADRLATRSLKNTQAKMVASLFDHEGEESPSSKG